MTGKKQYVTSLVGGFNPSEKYESKCESSTTRGEHKTYLKPPPRSMLTWATIPYKLTDIYSSNWPPKAIANNFQTNPSLWHVFQSKHVKSSQVSIGRQHFKPSFHQYTHLIWIISYHSPHVLVQGEKSPNKKSLKPSPSTLKLTANSPKNRPWPQKEAGSIPFATRSFRIRLLLDTRRAESHLSESGWNEILVGGWTTHLTNMPVKLEIFPQ